MGIKNTEILKYKSEVANDTSANGGRMSSTEVVSAVLNNVMDDITEAQRESGLTQYRKVFHKIANAANKVLSSVVAHLRVLPPGEDFVTLILGTQTDTQAAIVATPPREYGGGTLHAQVEAGGSVLVVDTKSATPIEFVTGDMIAVIIGTVARYFDNVTVVKSGNQYTITLDTGDTIPETLAATTTIIAACIEVALIQPTSDGWAEDSEAGTYNETSYPVTVENIGTVEQEWTITFTSATAFTCAGDTVGAVAAGSKLSSYAPLHPVFGTPYFTLSSLGWGGTWAEGDIVTFSTHPAAVPLWRKRVVPAGAADYEADGYSVRVRGQSN